MTGSPLKSLKNEWAETAPVEADETDYAPTVIERSMNSRLFRRMLDSESRALSIPAVAIVLAHTITQAAFHPEQRDELKYS